MVQDSVDRVEAAVALVVDSVEEEEVEMDPHLVSTTTREAVESAVMVETAKATLPVATGLTGGTAVIAIVSKATEEASVMEWIVLYISAMVTDLTRATMAEADTRTVTEEEEEETVITRVTTIKVAVPSDLIAEANDLPTLPEEISVEDHHEVGPVVAAEEEDLQLAVLVEASIAALPLPPRNKCGTKRTGGCASNVSEFVTFFFFYSSP